MVGDYTAMDWASIGAITGIVLTSGVAILVNSRDNNRMLDKIDGLSKKYDDLSDTIMDLSKTQHSSLLTKANDSSNLILEKNQSVKDDTTYIKDEMLYEKKSRESLYNSVSNADEVLAKLDFLRETIIQMQALHEKNEDLKSEIVDLKISNKSLSNQLDNQNVGRLIGDIQRFRNQLSEFEMYPESEEIQFLLKKIEQELTNG
ncbi:hypothetical protein AB1395_09640 [Streptococcus pluranimalium]|uniref:hypothetical protein n=1 Tax=Streptococcus pluranimalium TaxID=82348 RepID=UPI0034664A7E